MTSWPATNTVGPAYYHSSGYGNNYDIKRDILIDGKAEFILEIKYDKIENIDKIIQLKNYMILP